MNGQTFTLGYDAEGRAVSVTGPPYNAAFTYNADGQRVRSVINGVTTNFVGPHYEVTGTVITKYYFAGAIRVAMHKYSVPSGMAVEYFLSDHLGSTSLTTDSNGNKVSEMRYTAWGEVRYTWTDPNLNTSPIYALTRYTFTGQYSYASDFGLLYYGARMYDPALGRFVQADSIITGGLQGLDRYAYVNNSPVRYTDPSGHCAVDGDDWCFHGHTNAPPPTPTPTPTPPPTPQVTGVILIYCGATGRTVNDSGVPCGDPDVKGDMTGWGTTLSKQYPGYKIVYVTYPGSKAQQKEDALNTLQQYGSIPTIHVGFSAGGDTAVATADALVAGGRTVEAVILLDPAFDSDTLGMPNSSDFEAAINRLTGKGVHVFVADAYGGSDTAPLDISQIDTKFYDYQGYDGMDHYPVITSQNVFGDVFDFFSWQR